MKEGDTLSGIAQKYKVEISAITDVPWNNLQPPDFPITPGTKLIVMGGTKPLVTKVVTSYSGPIPNGARGTGQFRWPVVGRITQDFWSGHRAIDIAVPPGTPVYAADAGYVRDQVDQLLAGTREFVAAYAAGRDDEARALYASTRVHWERVETVAESFGDLDPKMDAREADLEEGQEWTGWHRIEKDLWSARAKGYTPLTAAQRATYGDDLLANTEVLHERTRDLTITVDVIANGAKGLLDEVATGKVTGEEEYWSRTDLWDFQANVDGARVAWEGLRDLLTRKDPTLDGQIGTRFGELQALLDQHRSGDGFVTYDTLSPAQVKQLSDAVNALSEPLSKLAGAVLS
ncbi:MAG: LysM peptidoglycan-binding domain-containing protein [Actinobacteria bacterium]|nr:LysM peptidoglycan-binding domain-containing protein [Actinomycetota bacterium]